MFTWMAGILAVVLISVGTLLYQRILSVETSLNLNQRITSVETFLNQRIDNLKEDI